MSRQVIACGWDRHAIPAIVYKTILIQASLPFGRHSMQRGNGVKLRFGGNMMPGKFAGQAKSRRGFGIWVSVCRGMQKEREATPAC